MKQLYFAPLEGITGHIYRRAHAAMFGGVDAYFAPFITPTENERLSSKRLRDILPENNENLTLKVQVLTKEPKAYASFEKKVKDLGYDEVNFNFGCPMPTIVNKNTGAGFLRDREVMTSFLEEIFANSKLKISVKTRLGIETPEEMDALMEVYNQFPLSELIIHPRTLADFYKGVPHRDSFKKAYTESKNPVCYNGDILTKADFDSIVSECPDISGVMIGRGGIKNPALFREIRGGAPLSKEEIFAFSDLLLERYHEILKSETHTLQKMKEVWTYMIVHFPEGKKAFKKMRKANHFSDFKWALEELKQLTFI